MDVFAYWNLQQLWTVFNAAAAMTGNNAYATLMFALVLMGFLVIMGVALAHFRAEKPFVWIIFLVLFHGILFVPKINVNIIDRTGTAAPMVVPNVPLGLAFFASTTSHIGDWLTRSYESLMSIPGPVRFGGNGMMFGDRVLQATMQSVVLEPQYNTSLMDYVRNCVMPDLLDGSKDVNTLLSTEQIWSYMGSTNPARATVVNFTTMTCPDAYQALNVAMTAQVNRAHEHLARRLNPEAARSAASAAAMNALAASQLPVAADLIMGVTTANSYDMVRQAMMVNLWSRVPGSISQAVGDPVAGQMAVADAQAAASTESSYRSMANIAEGTLPKIRNSIQVMGIAIFPIILLWILMAGQNGGMILKTYVGALMWIELWPPLYAVVNFVMQSSSRDHISAGLQGYFTTPISASGLNLQNMGHLAHSVLSDQAIGGMLTLIVPMIALVLVTGTIYALSGAVGQMMAPAAAAAQRFGGESGVGNLNMGNVRYDTFAARTHNANAYQSSGSVDAGGMSVVAPTNKHTSAYGSAEQAAGQPGASVVAKSNVANLGAGLTESSSTSASHSISSGTSTMAGTTESATNASTGSSSYSQRDTADYARRFSQAVAQGIRVNTGHSLDWQSGTDRSASQEGATGASQNLKESGTYKSDLQVDGQARGAPPSGREAGAIQSPSEKGSGSKGLGVKANTGMSTAAVDELSYTARTGANNKYGISQQQSAKILQDAGKTAEAGSRDEGTRAAGRSFVADLARGYTTSQILSGSVTKSSQAGDQLASGRANSIGTGIQSDQRVLDYFTQKSGLPPMEAANALNALRSASPAAFTSLVNEARDAYTASPQGQGTLTQGGIASPETQQAVAHAGWSSLAVIGKAGAVALDGSATINTAEVKRQQHASPGSMPNAAPVQNEHAAIAGKATETHQALVAHGDGQRGAGMLAQQAIKDEHGAMTPVQIAFAGWSIKSPSEIEGRINYVMQNDPAVAAQVEHLGKLPSPTEKQLTGTAEMVAASYDRLTK